MLPSINDDNKGSYKKTALSLIFFGPLGVLISRFPLPRIVFEGAVILGIFIAIATFGWIPGILISGPFIFFLSVARLYSSRKKDGYENVAAGVSAPITVPKKDEYENIATSVSAPIAVPKSSGYSLHSIFFTILAIVGSLIFAAAIFFSIILGIAGANSA